VEGAEYADVRDGLLLLELHSFVVLDKFIPGQGHQPHSEFSDEDFSLLAETSDIGRDIVVRVAKRSKEALIGQAAL
jgi:hypothetical protein